MAKVELKRFYSISGPRKAHLKIKRSDFICTMVNVISMEQAKAFISGVSKENKNATHNCWAYIVGEQGNIFHSSDAGEPSGTAGKPMLNMLQSYDLTCIAAVVTRIFGGVKLGVRGLIDAYGQAVQQAIACEPLIKLVFTEDFNINVPYAFNDKLLHHFSAIRGRIVNTRYEEQVFHRFRVEIEDIMACRELLNGLQEAGLLRFESQMQHKDKDSREPGEASGD